MAGDTGGLTRRDLLARAGAGVAALGLTGAASPYAFAGPHTYARRELKHDLRIIQWAHFVPGYDRWLDDEYAVRWGRANDTRVTIDHVNSTELGPRAAAEIATESGHDLFQLLSPPTAFQLSTIPLDDAVQEVTRKLGPQSEVARRSTYNPRTKHYFGFADHYVPDPAVWRRDLWREVGSTPTTWDRVLDAAPKLRRRGHPIGIGMSGELDSTMANAAIMLSFGARIQDADGNVRIDSKEYREYLRFMRALYRTGMRDDVLVWNPTSNNQLLRSGVGSLILNPISATRTAEEQALPFADDLALSPSPAGAAGRPSLAHTTGVYVIWRFSKNVQLAKRYLVDQQLAYRDHFVRSRFYNLPAWTNAVDGGFAGMRTLAAGDTHGPRGRYAVLPTIAERSTTNTGHPGFSNGAIGEIFDGSLLVRYTAQVAQGKLSADEAAKAAADQFTRIFEKWRDAKLL